MEEEERELTIMFELVKKYILGAKRPEDSTLQELQKLTERLVSAGSAPETSLMHMMVELSTNGIMALDKEGSILFFNPSAETLLRTNGEIQGTSIYSLVPPADKKALEDLIKEAPDRKVIKAPVIAKDGKILRVLDMVFYRVDNDDSTKFIVFVAECVEFTIFNCHPCPNKEGCQFYQKYSALFIGEKIPDTDIQKPSCANPC